jgi:hypothetical protein
MYNVRNVFVCIQFQMSSSTMILDTLSYGTDCIKVEINN